tara:strand:+ start:3249 stop:4205 length:957 start_codon:yes stop_codon:yes gene_type:complete
MKPENTEEWHSTDLTDHCPARVRLRLQGKISNRAPTAMVRGMLAGSALEYIHAHKTEHWGHEDMVWKAIDYAAYALRETLEEDNRILTDAAEKALKAELPDELEVVIESYVRRLAPLFAKTSHVGAEVPIRCSHSGVDFASHLDLVIYDPENVFLCKDEGHAGGLTVFDWKWRKDTPSKAYLARNQQFLLYWLACKHGKAQIDDGDDGKIWFAFNEHPGMAWVHLPSLKPYTRKVITKDDEGNEREFKKGDDRPLRQVIRVIKFEPSRAEDAMRSLCKKVEMYKNGFWPQNPDPVGCGICEAEDFCTRFDTVQLEGDE